MIKLAFILLTLGVVALLCSGASATPADTPGYLEGNPRIQEYFGECFQGDDDCELAYLKIDPPESGIYDGGIAVTFHDEGLYMDFISPGASIYAVLVKGGPNAYLYTYEQISEGCDLQAPINPKNDTPYQISHVEFAYCATPVPEPATMLLVGSGLLGLVAFGRRQFIRKR